MKELKRRLERALSLHRQTGNTLGSICSRITVVETQMNRAAKERRSLMEQLKKAKSIRPTKKRTAPIKKKQRGWLTSHGWE